VARQADFPTMNLIVEDFMKDNGAVFSGELMRYTPLSKEFGMTQI